MKKYIFFVLVLAAVAAFLGCHAGGSAPFINVPSESDILSFEREVDENGRFADIIFPSGAVIKCTQDDTLKKGTKITATEQKKSNGTPYYLYNITGKLFTDDALNTAVSVNTLEKPISVTLPNNSTTGICYIGTRASESDPWRYSLATDGLANIRFARLQAGTPSQCNFNLYRLGISFALFVFNNQSNDETKVDLVDVTPAENVEFKDGKYVSDLNIKVKVSGEKLDGIKIDNLKARIIYRSDSLNPEQLKANGSIVNQTNSDDKSVSGKYEHSFEISNIKIESQMSGEAIVSFVLNLAGVNLQAFPTSFLVEFFSDGKAENTLPFTYTQAFSFETKEQQNNSDNPDNPTATEYKITYNLDGGQKTADNPIEYNEKTKTFTLNEPTKVGYTFLGWTGSNGDTPEKTVTIAKGSTGAKEYTANWSLDIYEITYNNIDFCTFEKDNPTTYDITSASITLTNPTRTGCEFLGWTYEGQTTPTKTVKIEKGTTGNKEFTASFKLDLTLTIAQDEGAIIDEVNKLYYTKSTFTITPSLAVGAKMTDTEKANILSALLVKDSENNTISDISADWNNDGNIALAFSKDLTASTTYTISFGEIDVGNLTCDPKTFKTFYYKGKGTMQVPYQVENYEQLDLIRKYLSCHFIQTEDINLVNRNWETIGDMEDRFTGSYDGNQKKIEKLTISNGAGLFYLVSNGGKISNITVDGVSIDNGEIGIIAWGLDANCSIENCVVTDSTATSRSDTNSNLTGRSIGGICNTNYGSIKSCIIEKCNINNTNTPSIGGICYENESVGSIESCQVKDCNIKSVGSTSSMYDSISGICCYSSGSITKCDLINSCISLSHTDEYSGNYEGKVGGICCSSDGKINNCSVKNSEISCSTSSGKMHVGGICSVNSGTLSLCSLINSNISGSKGGNKELRVGGISATHESNTGLTSCEVQNSRVSGSGEDNTFVGGIVGYSDSGRSISLCSVKAGSIVEGIAKYCSVGGIGGTNLVVTDSYFDGSTVKGEGNSCCIGGICGVGNVISKCYVKDSDIIETSTSSGGQVGGICGSSDYNITSCYLLNSNVKGSGNNGTFTNYVGGICGEWKNRGVAPIMSSCYVYEDDSHSISKDNDSGYLGYLVGYRDTYSNSDDDAIIKDCFYNGTGTLVGHKDYDRPETNIYSGITGNNFTNQTWSDGSWSDFNTSVFPPTLNQN